MELQVNNLTEIVLLLRKQKFGSCSEKTPRIADGVQLNLFNEAELEASPDVPEPIISKSGKLYRRNPKTKREEILKDLPVEEIECDIHESECTCPKCNTKLSPIGKETVREELEYIPAQLKVIRYVRLAYGCPECKKKGEPYIKKALTPTSLMNHSLASPTAVAHVMYQKYVNSMPLYRQEQEWKQMGLSFKGADASAIVYSLVETAIANNLNVFTYLNYLLLYMTDMDYKNHPERMEDMMPWSERAQQECK